MPRPHVSDARTQQRQLHREWTRLRVQMLAGYRELEKRCDQLTLGRPRRVAYLVKATIALWKRRGSQHTETYLGPAALRSVTALEGRPLQSESSHKRAKRQVLDVWRGPEGQLLEGLGLLRRTHIGGGRLASCAGGGKNSRGHFRGNADGVMPGPEITGWTDEQYERLKAGPPPSPGQMPSETSAEYEQRRETEKREAFLEQYQEHQERPP